jgi:hypothetical protein
LGHPVQFKAGVNPRDALRRGNHASELPAQFRGERQSFFGYAHDLMRRRTVVAQRKVWGSVRHQSVAGPGQAARGNAAKTDEEILSVNGNRTLSKNPHLVANIHADHIARTAGERPRTGDTDPALVDIPAQQGVDIGGAAADIAKLWGDRPIGQSVEPSESSPRSPYRSLGSAQDQIEFTRG